MIDQHSGDKYNPTQVAGSSSSLWKGKMKENLTSVILFLEKKKKKRFKYGYDENGPKPQMLYLHCTSALYLSICISAVYHCQIDEEFRMIFCFFIWP